MKRLLLTLILCTSSIVSFAQNDTIKTINGIYEVDTIAVLKVESPNKVNEIFEDVSKIFKVKEYEARISRLDNVVVAQNVYIDSLSNVLIKYLDEDLPKLVVKEEDIKAIQADVNFLENLPESYENISSGDLQNTILQINNKILELKVELDSLVKAKADSSLIKSKENTLTVLEKERDIVNLTVKDKNLKDENQNLHGENDNLKLSHDELKKYLYIAISIAVLLCLISAVVLQRKRISVQDVEIEEQLTDINKKNSYLEHAARLIRHDMHSGINTYIPRGISSLEKRLTEEDIKRLKIELPLKMVKDGLTHTQRVYKSVYEFTNLVKKSVVLNRTRVNLKDLIANYISNNPYRSQVLIEDLGELEVNETLFCNAIENLIKNGLAYNNSESKEVKIYLEEGSIIVEDNGVGFSQKKLEKHLKKYANSAGAEDEKGLGLNICVAILEEHGFKLTCDETGTGTKMKIKINN